MHVSFTVRFSRLALGLSALGLLGAAPARGEQNGWQTGVALEQKLAAPVSISWSSTPAARALASLGRAEKISIVLDRRIDPDRELRLTLDREPLAEGLGKVAQALGAGYCQLGPIAYLGPPEMARRLRTLAALRLEDVKSLPQAHARKLIEFRTSHWDDLAEPRAIVAALAAEVGAELVGADKLPHDLWPAAEWPPLTWVDRMTLVAAQFDLTFRLTDEGRKVELVAIPETVMLARTYTVPAGQASRVARRWAAALPKARVVAEQGSVRLEGLLEDHEFLERRLQAKPAKRTTLTAGKEVYQLSVESAALSKVLAQMAERLNLEIDWQEAAIDSAGISPDQLISVSVKDASLDELLTAILKDTKLTYRRDGRTVSIFPARAAGDEQ